MCVKVCKICLVAKSMFLVLLQTKNKKNYDLARLAGQVTEQALSATNTQMDFTRVRRTYYLIGQTVRLKNI